MPKRWRPTIEKTNKELWHWDLIKYTRFQFYSPSPIVEKRNWSQTHQNQPQPHQEGQISSHYNLVKQQQTTGNNSRKLRTTDIRRPRRRTHHPHQHQTGQHHGSSTPTAAHPPSSISASTPPDTTTINIRKKNYNKKFRNNFLNWMLESLFSNCSIHWFFILQKGFFDTSLHGQKKKLYHYQMYFWAREERKEQTFTHAHVSSNPRSSQLLGQ